MCVLWKRNWKMNILRYQKTVLSVFLQVSSWHASFLICQIFSTGLSSVTWCFCCLVFFFHLIIQCHDMHLIFYSCCIFGNDWIWFFHCHKIHIFFFVLSNIWETCSTLNISGLVLREIKDFWRVALLLSILSYPEAENAADTLNKQDELHRRKEKYIRVERFITDVGNWWLWNLWFSHICKRLDLLAHMIG